MKLNNKGFAISSVMYLILIMVVILLTLSLSLLSNRKLVLDKLNNQVKNEIYNSYNISYRKCLSILKDEAEEYAVNNNLENTSIKVSELNSSIDSKILDEYNLLEKNLIVSYVDGVYDVSLES